MNLSRVVVIIVVTAAIVYAGLNFLLPRGTKGSAAAATAEAGFGAEVAAAASETSSDAAAPAAEGEAAAAPAEAEAAAETPALSEEEARAIAANVASEAAGGSAAAETGDAGASGLTEEQRNAIAGNIAAEESGSAAEEAAPPPAAPAPAPEVAAAEPAPVEEAAPAPSPAPAAAPKPRKPAAPAKPAAAPSYQANSGADVISAWWKKAGSSPNNLNLVYAGESTKDKAVVLIFDGEVDAAAAGASIKLVDAKGASPSGSWSNGNNGRVVAFKGVPSGRYTVIIGAGLASSGGKSVGKEVVGPVYVR